MAGKKIGLILALDGEKEFTQGLSNAKKEAQLFKTELKNLESEYKGNANSAEYLSQRQELLAKQQEAFTKKVNAAKDGLKNATEAYNKQSNHLNELKQRLEAAKSAQEELENSGQKGTSAYEKQTKEVDELADAVKKQSTNALAAAGRVTDWNRSVAEAEGDLRKCNNEIKQNGTYLDEAKTSANGCATSIDNFGKALKEAGDNADGLKDIGGNLESVGNTVGNLKDKVISGLVNKGTSIAVDAVAAGVDALKETMLNASSAAAQLSASTGLSESAAKRYKAVMESIKGDNFGESYEDVADVMSEVIQIMGELGDTDMTNITESAIALRDTFDMDINESIRAVDVMIQTMGVDAQAAFDLIAAGAQNGLNRSDELADNLTEYTSLWAQAGFSAEEMFGILENGLDAGAYNLDKVNDFVKEFGISLSDGRIEENLSSFSTGTQELFDKWKNGEATTSDVFYSVIGDLENMTDKQEALTVASDVWSALGEDNAMQVLEALNDVNDGYENVYGTMDKLKEVKYDDLGSSIAAVGNALKENLITPISDAVTPGLTSFFGTVAEAINDVGDSADTQEGRMDEWIQEIKDANDQLKQSIENADSTMESAETETAKISLLGDRLLELNGIQDKTLAQRYELRDVVAQLGQYIPEVTEAYDGEADKVNMTDQAIRDLISSKEQLIVTEAMEASKQELVNSMLEAQIQYNNASEMAAGQEELIKSYEERLSSLAKLDAQLQNNEITGEEYNKQLEKIAEGSAETADDNVKLTDVYGGLSEGLRQTTMQYDETTAAMEESGKVLEDGKKEIEDIDDAGQSLCDTLGIQAEKEEENSDSTKNAAEASDEYTASLEEQITAAGKTQEAADAQKTAMDSIVEAYQSAKEEIQSSLQDKISIFDVFDGGDETSVDEMLSNLQSQVEGIENWKSNLQTVKDQLGDEIAPEFIQYLEDMGIDGANALQAMVDALSQEGGVEKIEQMSDEYVEAMDLTEGISETGAANKVAMESAMGELGSSDTDFSALRDSIDSAVQSAAEGWAGLDETTRQALEQTVQTAQECGVQIPEGLTDGIASGETSPETALAQLQGSIQGSIEGLAQIASECGAEIPENLAESVKSGKTSAIDAYNQIIQAIAGKSPELAQAMTQGVETDNTAQFQAQGEQAGSAVAEGISSKQEEISSAVSSAMSGAESAGNSGSFSTMGEQIGDAIAQGIASRKAEINSALSSAMSADNAQAGTGFDAVGGQIATAIATGITAKQGDITNAAQQVTDAAKNAVLNAASSFQSPGQQAALQYSSGIAAGAGGAASVAAAMALQALNAASGYSGSFYSVGLNIAYGMASGISAGSSAAINAAASMASAALSAAKSTLGVNSPSKRFRDIVGKSVGEGFALGINLSRKDAVKASANMAKSVLAASQSELEIHSPSKKFRNAVGKKIGEGFAFGIKDSSSLASKAASRMSAKVYTNATNWLKKYKKANKTTISDTIWFWQQVEKHTKKGTKAYNNAVKQELTASTGSSKLAAQIVKNFGVSKTVKSGAKTVKKSAAQYSKEILNAAKSYLSAYKKTHKTSEKEDIAYWKGVRERLTKGTNAWYVATAKIRGTGYGTLEKAIANNFGVSKTETTGSGKNKKTTKKSASDYADDVYSAAEQYMKNFQTLNKVTTKQEIAYWNGVKARLKKGTQAWYDATAKISELKEQQEQEAKEALETQASVQDDILDKYKVYYKVSAKAEAQYWNQARKQFKAGTDERIEADQKYYEALQDWYDQRKELDEDYADNVKEINEELQDGVKELQDAYEDAVQSRKEDILSQMDLFEAWDSTGYDADTLLYNLKTQVAGLSLWEQQLEELGNKNISQGLLDELKEMGPDAAASIYSLNHMTAEQLKEYEELWEQKNALAESQAVKDNESLRTETNSEITELTKNAQAELKSLNAEYKAALAELNEGLSSDLSKLLSKAGKIGEDTVSSLIGGIKKTADSVDVYKSTTKVVKNVSAGLEELKQAGTVIGSNTLDNILAGLTDTTKIENAAQDTVDSIKRAIQKAAADEMQTELEVQETAADAAGASALNSLLSGYTTNTVVNVDTTEMTKAVQEMSTDLSGLLNTILQIKVVLDSGETVGALEPLLSQAMAASTIRQNGGRL